MVFRVGFTDEGALFLKYKDKFWFLSIENLYLRILKKMYINHHFFRPLWGAALGSCPCYPYVNPPLVVFNLHHHISNQAFSLLISCNLLRALWINFSEIITSLMMPTAYRCSSASVWSSLFYDKLNPVLNEDSFLQTSEIILPFFKQIIFLYR